MGTLLGLASALSWSIANVAIQPASRRLGTVGSLLYAQLVSEGILAAFRGPTG